MIYREAVMIASLCLTVTFLPRYTHAGAEPAGGATVLLWPDDAKLNKPAQMGRVETTDKTRIRDIKTPHLKVYPGPKSDKATPAVILVPGGGYKKVVPSTHWPIQKWFTEQGVRAFIMMYRVPGGRQGALQDIQQAMKLVRSRAKEWNIDPKRVGLLGSSAGGHLCVRANMEYKDASTKPDFTILLYPAYVANRGTKKVNDWVKIPADIAPTFLTAARDDTRHFPNSPAYEEALKAAGASVRSQYFDKGGHGFTVNTKGVEGWTETCAAWLKEIKILP
jgi:acetyl esterase/lipase